MNERQRPTPSKPVDAPSSDDEGAEAPDTSEQSKDSPASLDWWLKDGPDSPIAADIEEPEKHL